MSKMRPIAGRAPDRPTVDTKVAKLANERSLQKRKVCLEGTCLFWKAPAYCGVYTTFT